MKHKILIISWIILTIIVLGSSIWFFDQVNRGQKSDEVKVFSVQSGQSVQQIATELKNQGLVRSKWVLIAYLEFKNLSEKLKAGDYALKSSFNIKQTAEILSQGKTASVKITIPEGWNTKEIADYLEKEKAIKGKKEFEELLFENFDFSFLSQKPGNNSLEGFLFPDTYFLPFRATPKQIIEIMLKNFDQKLEQNLRDEISKSSYSLYEIVIIASLVEREVKKEDDRKIVAGIIYKRLAQGKPLELDATINFITGKNNPQSTLNDLAIDSPYNTYQNIGLPPGPISNPGLSAIKASIYPTKSPYLYYLNRQDTGETIFSQTFEEHLQNQAKYLPQ